MKRRIKALSNLIRLKIFQPFFRKMSGWNELEERLNTMQYIINHSIDITNLKKADGVLRQCQLGDTEMLRIVCQTLEKHNLTYWLDYGTLLGAVRHGGFIPWDDDLDIAMPREEYYKACEFLGQELKEYGIHVDVLGEKRMGVIIWEGGIIMDIFPMDNIDADTVKSHQELRDKVHKYRKFYNHHNHLSQSELKTEKERIIGALCRDNPLWYHNPEFMADGTVYDNDTIFPLKRIKFEQYEFYVPNNYDEYLKEYYGDYMSFPRGGVLHHGGGNNTRIIDNPNKYKTDMERLIEKLKSIKIE